MNGHEFTSIIIGSRVRISEQAPWISHDNVDLDGVVTHFYKGNPVARFSREVNEDPRPNIGARELLISVDTMEPFELLSNPGVYEQELGRRFTYHPPKNDQAERYLTIRMMAHKMARGIVEMTPPSREQSLALTRLEGAVMWANSAIARRE